MFEDVAMQILAGVILTFIIQAFTIMGLHSLNVLEYREEDDEVEGAKKK